MKRECDFCTKAYEAKTKRSRFCGDACRQRANRAGGAVVKIPKAKKGKARPAEEASSLPEQVVADLEAACGLNTALGRGAVELAERIVSSLTPPQAVAGLHKELRATLAEAKKGAKAVADPIDELRARREARHAGGA